MGTLVAKVAVSKAIYAIDKPYDYLVPEALCSKLQPGMRVIVPFGSGSRSCDGLILALQPNSDRQQLKPILAQLDDRPVLDEQGIKLALWMRERYFCTVYDAVKAMLPAGLYFSLKDSLVLRENLNREAAYETVESSKTALQLLELLYAWNGRGDVDQIREAFGTRDPNPAIKFLVEHDLAAWETSAHRSVGDKTEKIAVLAIPAEEALALVAPNRRRYPLRYAVTELLCALGTASAKELCYFTGASNATLRGLEKSGILTLEKQEVFRSISLEHVEPADPPILNEEQQTALEGLSALCQSGKPAAALLYGVTGSGKTQVYIRLIQKALEEGRTAMVLVPEISLTPQLLRIFASHFGNKIAVLHSSLRAGERYDEWKRIRSGAARVVIGTRSAVFAPLDHLGLIVLDEEQETSYKSENTPRYHAREVAKFRCVQNNALLLLGSATPSIETMYHAKQGTYRLFRLKHRFNERALPDVWIADMKKDLRAGNGTNISNLLQEELLKNFDSKEQSILFLNRRGASSMVSCGECGEVPSCPRCSIKLTYHSANQRLMCHYCGHSQVLPPVCPSCGGSLNFIGVGTQRIQDELKELFPEKEVLRMDTDTVSASNSHERILSRFQKENIPILVGTQMVAKGLDFENVTLVGVMAADLALYVDDYRAGERTFSLITQVVGRAGRGGKQGRAVIQTYTPENDVIRFAAKQDYDSFYDQEILLREARGYPPFRDMLVFMASGPSEALVLRACSKLRHALESHLHQSRIPFQLLGPAPASIAKVNNRYRYRLTLMCENSIEVRRLAAHLLQAAHQDKENRGVSVFADFNPYD